MQKNVNKIARYLGIFLLLSMAKFLTIVNWFITTHIFPTCTHVFIALAIVMVIPQYFLCKSWATYTFHLQKCHNFVFCRIQKNAELLVTLQRYVSYSSIYAPSYFKLHRTIKVCRCCIRIAGFVYDHFFFILHYSCYGFAIPRNELFWKWNTLAR